MKRSKFENSQYTPFEIHQINASGKFRDSPTSSILKTPTPIFVTTRQSSAKTKKLKFANGPVDLINLRNGSHESNVSLDSGIETVEEQKFNNGEIIFEDNVVEVAVSPQKTMQVSPESWKLFSAYKKYNDYANEAEKTDYTYSRLSKFRHKEIIPGFSVRPNLSRSPIYSHRSSLFATNHATSFDRSTHSKTYNSDHYRPLNSKTDYNFKPQNQSFKRSKYYLRSSSFDETETNEIDVSPGFVEHEFCNISNPESSEPNAHYYGKIRSMSLDDDDIDEVDEDSGVCEKIYYSTGGISSSSSRGFGGKNLWFRPSESRAQTLFQYLNNFFTTVFLCIASAKTLTKNFFSKYILRRKDEWNRSAYSDNWKHENLKYSTIGSSWIPHVKQGTFSSASYYSGKYHNLTKPWYERIFYNYYDRFKSLLWRNSEEYAASGYYKQSRKRKWWWLLIPMILLIGSFLGYVNFFSNPQTILNTICNMFVSIPSFIYYTIMVFIPQLLFEVIPDFITAAIPNFVMVTLPYFLTAKIPYFSAIVQFFEGISVANFWNVLTGFVLWAGYFVMSGGQFFYNLFINLVAGLGLLRIEQESGFLSKQYKQLDCRTNGFFTSMESTLKPVWRSGYVAYKRAAASASCYVNDSWERLKLPFVHINEWLSSKLSFLSNTSLGFVVTIWNHLWEALKNYCLLFQSAVTSLWLSLSNFFTGFLSAVSNVSQHIFRYFINGFFIVTQVFGNLWNVLTKTIGGAISYLYLLLFTPRDTIKYDYITPDAAKEVCSRQQKSIELLTKEFKDFKIISQDLSALKKKIDDLELEFQNEKESRLHLDEFHNKKLDENHRTLQKYQAMVNNALLSNKRPSQMSVSSMQYFLDNQSDSLKQWIMQNFLLKSDSSNIDEHKLGVLIAKHSNTTEEELIALKREFGQFVLNHKNELELLRSNINTKVFEGSDVSVSYIRKLIADAIKLYDADKTGKADYALETAGGQIQSIRCTETYIASPKSYVLLGWAVYTKTSSPRDAISPGMAAGQCWAFVGSQGFLVIQLSHTIKVSGFTMEHISKWLVPKGHIESAPKKFSLWGLKSEHDVEPYLFGEYTYLDNGDTLQYFPVIHQTSESYNLVELKILSNHGNPNYTCLYRIRVHGDPA